MAAQVSGVVIVSVTHCVETDSVKLSKIEAEQLNSGNYVPFYVLLTFWQTL